LTANLPSVVTLHEGTRCYPQRAFFQSQASPQQSPRRYTAGAGKPELSAVLGRAIDLCRRVTPSKIIHLLLALEHQAAFGRVIRIHSDQAQAIFAERGLR